MLSFPFSKKQTSVAGFGSGEHSMNCCEHLQEEKDGQDTAPNLKEFTP